MKCKTARALVLVRQREPLCQSCLEAGISGKVRALKTHKLLLPNDHVAVAFSGGSCSQALLCSVLPMRKDANTARKERGKIEFQLSVIHINEAAAYGLDRAAAEAHAAAVAAAAAACGAAAPAASVHVVPLSDVFLLPPPSTPHGAGDGGREASATTGGTDAEAEAEADATPDGGPDAATGAREAREARLRALLQSVPDPTGREDLMSALRGRLLSATAARLGACKLLRGDSGSALAARVIADTAKGRGYALPGDIQLLDARDLAAGQPALLYPMREVTLKEAVYMCRLRGLRPAELPRLPPAAGPRRSINDLAHAFIGGLQANLPSTVFTVLRTAAALRPFPFNAIDTIAPPAPTPAPAGAAAKGKSLATTTAAAPSQRAAAEHESEAEPGTESSNAVGGSACVGTSRLAVACCVLCRAPLSQRERDAITAARAAAAGRAGLTDGGMETGRGAGECAPPGLAGAGDAGPGGEANGREANGGDADDSAAPFCTSCRTQILCTPGDAALGLYGGVGFGDGSATRSRLASKVLPLLPAALLGPGK